MKKTLPLVIGLILFLCPACSSDHDIYKEKRRRMVDTQIERRGIKDKRVLAAMLKVPRHRFVAEDFRDMAYGDHPLPIAAGQTISQPYIVALMTQALALKTGDRVLEIGTGSGYQAAILAEIAAEVYTIEIHRVLARDAAALLKELGYSNVKVRHGDGFYGWKEAAPFDAVIVTAAAPQVPPRLIKQLKEGGRLILPRGDPHQTQKLILYVKKKDRLQKKELSYVRFVPMTGEVTKKEGKR